jgi:large subunit ribosomal protein L29
MADTNEGATSAPTQGSTKTRRKATVAEMRESTPADLEARVKKTEEQLFQHKLKRYTNQLANTNLIGAAKRDIARAKTLLAQKAAHAANEKGTK